MPLTFALSPVQFIFLIHPFILADSTPGGLLDFSKKHSTQDDVFLNTPPLEPKHNSTV